MKFKIKDWELKKAGSHPLKDFKTRSKPLFESEELAAEALKETQDQLQSQQERLYAQQRHSVLIVLQGMDTAGKDGLIKHVMSGINPSGCHVTSFKAPTHLELAHDYLWRAHAALPARGRIGVFNRSYYEDIIVPHVHPKFLPEGESLKERCRDIAQFEKYLSRQNVRVVKIYLHLSREEQTARLLARLDDPAKNWKFSDADVKERKHWKRYQEAYDFCFRHTSHALAPWHIVPADDKGTARVIASKVILHYMESLKLEFPRVNGSRRAELKKIRKAIGSE